MFDYGLEERKSSNAIHDNEEDGRNENQRNQQSVEMVMKRAKHDLFCLGDITLKCKSNDGNAVGE
jgi:hypothetical protein